MGKYPNNFYFIEQLHLDELKDKKFNVIGEIVRNLIEQSDKERIQTLNYINILHYLNLLRNINNKFNGLDKDIINDLKDSEKDISSGQDLKGLDKNLAYKQDLEDILKSLNLKDISKNNIFILITNGPYLLFRIIFDILNELFKNKKNNFDEEYLKEKVNEYNDILSKFTESQKTIKKKIENLYNLFSDLRNKNINHCVLYIGSNSENLKDDEFFKRGSIISEKNYEKKIEKNERKSIEKKNEKIFEEKEEFEENIKEFIEIMKIKTGIRNILNIKKEFDAKYELFGENVLKELNYYDDNKIFDKIKIKNLYKLTLNIYLPEKRNINLIMSDNFEISQKQYKNVNKEFIYELKKNYPNEINIILVPLIELGKLSGLNNDNILIFSLEIENSELINQLYTRFEVCGGVYKRYLKDKFLEQYSEKIEKLKSNLRLSKYSNLSELLNIINTELKSEFEINEESFQKAFKSIAAKTEIDNDLIFKIIKDMKKTCKKELNDEKKYEDFIRQNITKLEEKIKIYLFCNIFINEILLNACENSIINQFEKSVLIDKYFK